MTLLISFVIAFLVGPLLFNWLSGRNAQNILMPVVIVILILLAWVTFWISPTKQGFAGFFGVFCLWLGWVLLITHLYQQLRRFQIVDEQPLARAISMAATTIPWLGLATALWVTG